MVVEFLSQFSKDLNFISQKSVKINLIRTIELMEKTEKLSDIPQLKKLKGHKSAYRLKIGDYRAGFFYEAGKVTFARIIHRKDIYKVFP